MPAGIAEDQAGEVQAPREFYATPLNRIVSIVLSLVLSAFGGLMASVVLGRGDLIGVGFVAIAVVGAVGSLRWMRRAWSGTAALRVDEEGIIDGTALGPPVRIPWRDVASVSADGSTVRVKLHAGREVGVPLARRAFGWLFRQKDWVIPTRFLDAPPSVVEASICDTHEALQLQDFRRIQATFPSDSE